MSLVTGVGGEVEVVPELSPLSASPTSLAMLEREKGVGRA